MTSDAFKARDASSYDAVTEPFDRFTRWLSRPLAARLVALAAVRPGYRILDVGTGTGIVAVEAARATGPDGCVLGVDLSEGMLRSAAQTASRAALGNTEFGLMDAEALALADGSFDAVLSLFALLHFPDPRAALGEMFRVVRAGGRIALGVGSGPSPISWSGVGQSLRRARRVWRELRGRRLTGPSFLDALVHSRIPRGVGPEETHLARHTVLRPAAVAALVRRAGFRDVRTSWQGREAPITSAEEFWEIQRTFSSLARKRLSTATPDELEAVRAAFFAKCRDVHTRGGELVFPYAALFVVGRRP